MLSWVLFFFLFQTLNSREWNKVLKYINQWLINIEAAENHRLACGVVCDLIGGRVGGIFFFLPWKRTPTQN
jgi:hypothetical protein